MSEPRNTVTLKGKPLTLVGNRPKVGGKAPDFTLAANDMSTVTLKDFAGKILVIAAVPSLDTPVCDLETHKFNEKAGQLGDDVLVLTVSMDLPFAQKRWCGAAGIRNVKTLSDHRAASFGEAYGVLIKELRLLARSVFVVDKQGNIRYVEVVPEVSSEPDYDAVLNAVAALKKP